MAPTNNVKMVHQPSLHDIESNLDRLGLLSSTHGQTATKRTNHAPIILDKKPTFLKTTRQAEIRKIEIPRSMAVETLSW